MFSNQESKKKGVKGGVDVDRGKNRREDMSLSLRTRKRDELLEKRRNMGDEAASSPVASTLNAQAPNEITEGYEVSIEGLPSMVEKLRSENMHDRMVGTQLIRKLLSVESHPPIDDVIRSGAVPMIIDSLRCHTEPRLQFEAAWALTNIASGTSEHTLFVIQAHAVPPIVDLLDSPVEDVLEQAIWTLGNIAGDGANCRDYVLELGVLEKLLAVITNTGTKLTLLRNTVWALSNLCRGKPVPDFSKVGCSLPVLVSLLHHYDNDVVTDACWSISYLSDGPNDRVQRVIETGVVPRLVQLLAVQESPVQMPAIRVIGNIVTGDDFQTQVVINHGALANFHFLTTHPRRNIRKEVCWTISNIAAGTKEQIQALINANLIPSVIQQLSASEFDVRKEAAWTFSNLTTGGTIEQIQYIVEQGVIPPLCDALSIPDSKTINVALETLENILKTGVVISENCGGMQNPFIQQIIDCGGLDKIEQLQNHNSNDVYRHAVALLDAFFETEDETAMGTGIPSAPMFGGERSDTNANGNGQFSF